MTERERILSRLDKILARTRSGNPHEAATASKMADEIMAKHSITEADLKQHADSGYFEKSLGYVGFNTTWKFVLATAAAKYHGCEAIALKVGRKRKVRLVGERSSVEKAAVFFEDLLSVLAELERSEAKHLADDVHLDCGPKQCADSWRRGAVACLVEKMAEAQPGSFGRKPVVQDSPADNGIWAKVKSAIFGVKAEGDASALALRDKRKDHAEKIKAKYAPRMTSVDRDDVASANWYARGYGAALSGNSLRG